MKLLRTRAHPGQDFDEMVRMFREIEKLSTSKAYFILSELDVALLKLKYNDFNLLIDVVECESGTEKLVIEQYPEPES